MYYTGTFLVGSHRFGVSFPKLKTFSEIFWALLIDYSLNEKMILGIFVNLFIYKVTTIRVFTRSAFKLQQVCERAIFTQSASIVF